MNEAPLQILYRDEHLVAIDKPSGLLVHRSPIDRHETRFAVQMVRDQIAAYVYPVHRLDKPTSGVLLFALTPDVAREVSLAFQAGTVRKRYLAVTRGYAPEQGVVDYALSRQLDKLGDRDAQADKAPQVAITDYRRLATVELPVAVDRYPNSRYSLMQLAPRTGRKHQLRRHMKHLGYPIIGDAKHGKGVHNRFFRQQFHCDRLLLACTELTLEHPVTGRVLQLQAGLDRRYQTVMTELGWEAWLPGAAFSELGLDS
jgi:tRNA pseudouridine65 synthase